MHRSRAGTYYRAMLGSWWADLRLELLDVSALALVPDRLDRLAVRGSAVLGRWGPMRMRTRVEATEDPGRFLHTTRVSGPLGAVAYRSEEALLLGSAGRVDLVGTQWRFPFPWRAIAFRGVVTIDEDAKGAEYDLEWMGTRMRQRTQVVPEGLSVLQETPFSRSAFILRRE